MRDVLAFAAIHWVKVLLLLLLIPLLLGAPTLGAFVVIALAMVVVAVWDA